ncbi:PaREP1 family protein [Candidatus Methanodesulfokora washburnensis]|uniref:PaREP1/PaREP8 domain-contain protein n=1 Tax=Candidatus Methanodesulfokora washburnensis TaxID=2478471 RepID=A0A429GRF7_9CREN|nr:PaREP1/PaREP8 domain-contain protein [Candidatus Methanodesulfokores washburnensis]
MPAVIELPEEIYRALESRARALGKDIVDVAIDSMVNLLDPKTRVEVYLKLYEKYLSEAEELYKRRDLSQSGEKYWGAVAALLNAIAEKKGWPHYSHRDYADIVEKLSEELKEPLGRLFASAERLHANYYHNFLTELNFEAHREDVLELLRKLKAL